LPPFVVVDDDGQPVEPIARFLRDFLARGHAAGSVRSYAHDLLRWWRFLRAIDVAWDQAGSAEVRDFALWLGQTAKSRTAARTTSLGTVGQVNLVTGKPYLSDRFAARTIRHGNAVLRCFYEFSIEAGVGPLVNPVVLDRVRGGGRASAHHNPLEPFRAEGRLRYNPKPPRPRPRAMPDERWDELFAAMRSDRDRAILALAISTGARAGELLGLRVADIDWGGQTVRVFRKGSGAAQWLPASGEALVWLRLWLAELGEPAGADPVWQTLRRRSRPGRAPGRRVLTYDAWRAVLRRANDHLGTNWSMHDCRHTCALRMLRSDALSLRDVQAILGHAQLTTTQMYLITDDAEVLARAHRYLTDRARPAGPPTPAAGYDAGDLAVLLGRSPR
jgi:integrase